MRLSSIKLSGFKSFVDSTTINLDSNLIGVIGPNGCGKSNVIDAVKWVLGESSAKNLRSDSMADVIFNGSDSRKPIGTASVELLFDNTDQKISGPYASYNEVSIRRVVSRDGISNYFLNNANCRRKDVTNLLLGTGLGSSGYSIIEQGMISKIIDAKPEEIRGFIEEAAGVTKFKDRRKDTLSRLSHTKENLERINDIASEITKQLEKLNRQARNAERYKVLKKEQQDVRSEIIYLEISELTQSRDVIQGKISTIKSRLNQLEADKTSMRSNLLKLKTLHDEEQFKFDSLQKDYYETSTKISNKENNIALLNQNISSLNTEIVSLANELIETSDLLESDVSILTNHSGLDANLLPELTDLKINYAKSEQSLNLYKEELENINHSIDNERDQLRSLQDEKVKYDAEMEQLESEISKLAEMIPKLEASIESSCNQIYELEATNANLAVITKENELSNIKNKLQQDEEVIFQLTSTSDSNLRLITTAKEEVANLQGQLSTIENLDHRLSDIKNHDATIEKLNLTPNDRLLSKVIVNDGWEHAIDLILLDKVNAFKIDNFQTILDQISLSEMDGLCFYKSNNNSMNFNSNQLHFYLETDFVFDDLIGVYIATDLEHATKMLPNLNKGESIVTKDGAWVTHEFIKYSSKDSSNLGYLSIKDRIKNLNEQIASLASILFGYQNDQEQYDDLIRKKKEDILSLRSSITERADQLFFETSKRDKVISQIDFLQQQKIKLIDDKDSSYINLDVLKASISDKANAQKTVIKQIIEHQSYVESLKQTRMNALNQLEEATIDVSIINQRIHEIEMEIGQSNILKSSTQTGIERLEEQQINLTNTIRDKKTSVLDITDKVMVDTHDLETLLTAYNKINDFLKSSKIELQRIHENTLIIDNELVDVDRMINTDRINQEESNLNNKELEVMLDNLMQDLEEMGLKIEVIKNNISPEANSNEWRESLESLSQKISNLGAINLAAIDEKEEEEERKNYLEAQIEDLNNAIQVLEAAISKIDNDTKERFRETFDGANKALKELFPVLFGGGQAFLKLDSDDLLTAGIHIMSSPPGKKIHNISMLSGGEKTLTAIAFIFSMFKLNPSPFCLLDEVDAPLDESNVSRFIDLVKVMSEQVQFLLVTHNKTTMSVLDQLMGVTMGEPGVSRLVSVNLNDAVNMIDK
jgi:chromosome segregation protein